MLKGQGDYNAEEDNGLNRRVCCAHILEAIQNVPFLQYLVVKVTSPHMTTPFSEKVLT